MALITTYWGLDVLILFVSLLIGLYFYLTAPYTYWKKRNVPFAETIPIFGSFLPVLLSQKNCDEFLNDCYNMTTEPYVGIYIGNKPHLIIRDLNLAKHVLVKDFNNFYDRLLKDYKHDPLGSRNLFAIRNPHWKLMRTKLTPFFTSGRMKQMFVLISDVGKRLNAHIENLVQDKGITVDLKHICASYTVDVITSCAYGIEANSFSDAQAEFNKFGRQIFQFDFLRSIEFTSFFFIPEYFNLFKFSIFGKSTKFLRHTLWQVIKEREESGVKRPDLIETLIKLKNENVDNNLVFEGDTLVAQAAIFFSAGFETSSTTMNFLLYHLALDIEKQQKVRREIIGILGKYDNNITYEAIKEMKYLEMCFLETLRMYPVLPFLNRECTKDYTFPGTSLTIEKGTPVIIPVRSYQNDPQYFPEPEKFIPERFSSENNENITQFSFIPFGDGPHNCIGERFGHLTVKVGIVQFLKDFEVQRTDQTEVPLKLNPKAAMLAPENGIFLKLRKLPTLK